MRSASSTILASRLPGVNSRIATWPSLMEFLGSVGLPGFTNRTPWCSSTMASRVRPKITISIGSAEDACQPSWVSCPFREASGCYEAREYVVVEFVQI